MGLIKKGKLFGILNALDILIILAVSIIVIPLAHYYVKLNNKGVADQMLLEKYLNQKVREEISNKELRTGIIEVNVSFKNIPKNLLSKIKPGDKEVLPDGTVYAEVLEIGKPEENYFYDANVSLNSSEFLKIKPDGNMYALPALMRLRGYVGEEGVFRYKSKAINYINFYPFKTSGYEADFTVEMYPYNFLKTAELDAYASFKDVKAEDINKIKVGDREMLPDGTVSAEIIWIGKPEPNYYYIIGMQLAQNKPPKVYTDNGEYSVPVKIRLTGVPSGDGNKKFAFKGKSAVDMGSYDFNGQKYKGTFIIEMYPTKKIEDYGAPEA